MDYVALRTMDQEIAPLASQINAACLLTDVPPCLLGAIIKRETRGRNIFQIGVPRGPGCGVGPCQITAGVRWDDLDHPTYSGLDITIVENNLKVAVVYFLAGLVRSATVAQKASPRSFETACRGQIVFAVACGYNAGFGNVERALIASQDADYFIPTTKGEDGYYGGDVLRKYIDLCDESHDRAAA